MPARIKRFLRSFSFRTGLIFFIVLVGILMALRFLTYYQTVRNVNAETRFLISAYSADIEESMKKYGIPFTKGIIKVILKNSKDRNIFISLVDHNKKPERATSFKKVVGSFKDWPVKPDMAAGWYEVKVTTSSKQEINLLAKLTKFTNNTEVLIGYDLNRIEMLKNAFYKVIVIDIMLALISSFLFTIVIIMLININLKRINATCEAVIKGNLHKRVGTRDSGDQFDHLSGNINKMLDWINTLLNSARDSGNALAHDMRTPISRLKNELTVISNDKSLSEDASIKIKSAAEKVDVLIAMFDNILNISKAENRSGTELFSNVDFKEILTDALEFYQPMFESKDIELKSNIGNGDFTLNGDKQLLSQSIINLLDNAIKFSPENSAILVSLYKEDKKIIFTVADNGPGIPEAFREKVKERFYRMDSSRHTEGTGLGLSLINAIAKLHSGEFILEDNNPGLKAVVKFKV